MSRPRHASLPTSHDGKRHGLALVSLLMLLIAGCAARPGPEVLVPVPETVAGARIITIYVASTRSRENPDSNVFTSGRAAQLNYAEFRISIPPGHQTGKIEWPKGSPNPATSFVTVEQRVLDRAEFAQGVEARRLRGDGKAGVFIHGYNTNFQESLFELAQMAADAGIDTAPVLFAWPSEGTVTGYLADKEAVTYSRDGLADVLTLVANQKVKSDITVIGHSMGAWLTVEALRQLRLTGRGNVLAKLEVVLAAPDIDIDVFRAQTQVIGPLNPPMTVLVSRDDVALSLSGKISGERPRVGALNVDDPWVREAALKGNFQIIDISELKGTDGFNHDRYLALAAFYPKLAANQGGTGGRQMRQAGAFVFNAVGATLAAPFSIAGQAIAGQ